MRVDFLPFAVEGGAQEKAFVDMVGAGEEFVEDFVDLVGILNFGVEAEGAEVNAEHVEIAAQWEIADDFEQGAVATEAEDQIGVFEHLWTGGFVFVAEDFADVLVPA